MPFDDTPEQTPLSTTGEVAGIVLLNGAAGLAHFGDDVERLRGELHDAGATADVRPVEPEELAAEVVRAIQGGCRKIGVCGGDGSIASAAAVLVGTDHILAPFPGGTLNHFARRLGITDERMAVAAFGSTEHRNVPVGIIDDTIFLNTATFGFYARVVRHRDRLRRWMPKKLAGLIASVAGLIKLPQYAITVSVEGRTIQRVTPLIWLGVEWAQKEEDPGHLQVMIVTARTRGQMLRLVFGSIFDLLRGAGPDARYLESAQGRNLTISGPPTLSVTLDGEVRRMNTPVFVGMVDGALTVTCAEAIDAPGADSGRERHSIWSRLLWSNWPQNQPAGVSGR